MKYSDIETQISGTIFQITFDRNTVETLDFHHSKDKIKGYLRVSKIRLVTLSIIG